MSEQIDVPFLLPVLQFYIRIIRGLYKNRKIDPIRPRFPLLRSPGLTKKYKSPALNIPPGGGGIIPHI